MPGPVGARCPVLSGRPCTLAEEADVLVYDAWATGEPEGAERLIEGLRELHPDVPVVLTATGIEPDWIELTGRHAVVPSSANRRVHGSPRQSKRRSPSRLDGRRHRGQRRSREPAEATIGCVAARYRGAHAERRRPSAHAHRPPRLTGRARSARAGTAPCAATELAEVRRHQVRLSAGYGDATTRDAMTGEAGRAAVRHAMLDRLVSALQVGPPPATGR